MPDRHAISEDHRTPLGAGEILPASHLVRLLVLGVRAGDGRPPAKPGQSLGNVMQISPWISVEGYNKEGSAPEAKTWVTLLIQYGLDGRKEARVTVQVPGIPKD